MARLEVHQIISDQSGRKMARKAVHDDYSIRNCIEILDKIISRYVTEYRSNDLDELRVSYYGSKTCPFDGAYAEIKRTKNGTDIEQVDFCLFA